RAQEVRIEQLGLIARAVVGEDRYDGVAGPELAGETDRARHVDARGAAEAQAFVLEEIEDDRHRLMVGNLGGAVYRIVFQGPGDAALADALGDRGALRLEHAVGVEAVERRAHRVGERDLHVLVARLERHGDAGERAAGADRAGEAVDLPVGLLPDLRTGRLEMAR